MKKYPHVLSPRRVGAILLKNRIISGPSTLHSMSDGQPYPTERVMRFFEARAKAGAGMVTVTGVSTGPAFDDGIHMSWNLYQPNHTNALAELASRIHFYGARASMELLGIFPDGYTVSDGARQMNGEPGREIPVAKMEEFKNWYAEDAAVIKSLGYDAILLHFGHSIPIAQFLSPYTNRRTDQYGGSTENRCRYIVEILQAIRKKAPGLIVEVRISGSEFQKGGIDLEEGIRIGEILQDYCDILQVSAGMHNPDWMTVTHPCGFLPPMPNVFLAEAFKKSGRIRIPITTVGAIPNLDAAEEIIASGKADFVAMTRAFIADIDMIKKCREGRVEDVRPCVKCMRCHDSTTYERHLSCTVNPAVGLQHLDHLIAPPAVKKKVAVIGGGPAGMQAALTAAERGHYVTLFEKTDTLGGKIKYAKYVPFKYPLDNFREYLIRQINKSAVDVRLNTEVKPEDVKGYDAVIAAVGSEPLIPPIPGVEHALIAVDVFGRETELGERVIIVGGGQVGCELAIHLAHLGKDVTVLEMQQALAPDASTTQRDELLVEMRKEAERLHVVLAARCTAIAAGSVTYEKDGESVSIAADAVILATGMKGLTELADSFMGLTEEYAQAGDCVRARTVEHAIKEGWFSAINL
ncbi:FAD-dependent oxidoreductase [Moorella sulfitireducens]|uniref:oxidoreductase n=1 Tax=Neomoorella sulfitireducens TaxID=2972948 RepID=UPI0021AC7B97|nr:FAD-dependent oxidoreductase [Moorella sulfitireducens]